MALRQCDHLALLWSVDCEAHRTLDLAKRAKQHEHDGRSKANAIGRDSRCECKRRAPPPRLLLKVIQPLFQAIQTGRIAISSRLSLAEFSPQFANRQGIHA